MYAYKSQTYNVASAPAGTISVFMRRIGTQFWDSVWSDAKYKFSPTNNQE